MYAPPHSSATAAAATDYFAAGGAEAWRAFVAAVDADVRRGVLSPASGVLLSAQVRVARAQGAQDDDALDAAVALTASPPPGADRRAFLAVELVARGERLRRRTGTDDVAVLVAAVTAVDAPPDQYTHDLLNSSTAGLLADYERNRDPAVLSSAIALCARRHNGVLDPVTRAALANNESNIYLARASATGSQEDFDHAAAVAEEALAVLAVGEQSAPAELRAPWEQTRIRVELTLLGVLSERWRTVSINDGLAAARAAVEVRFALLPDDHPMRSSVAAALGSVEVNDAALRGDAAAADRAVDHYRRAVEQASAGTMEFYVAVTGLVAALQTVFDHTGDTDALDEAIDVIHEVRPAASGAASEALDHNLAVCLRCRYLVSHDVTDLERALELHRLVDARQAGGDSWADLRDLEHARTAYRRALHDEVSDRHLDLALSLALRVARREQMTLLRLRAWQHVAEIAVRDERWSLAAWAADRALAAVDEVLGAIASHEWIDWLRPVQGAATLGAIGAARVGDLTASVELLERGAGIEAAGHLGHESFALHQARATGHEAVADRYAVATERVRALLRGAIRLSPLDGGIDPASTSGQLAGALVEMREARSAVEALIGPIAPSATVVALLDFVARTGEQLTYLAAGQDSGMRVDLAPDPAGPTIRVTWLEDLTMDEVADLRADLDGWTDVVEGGRAVRGDHPVPDAEAVADVQGRIAELVGAALPSGNGGALRLVPGGGLISLPVTAALLDVEGWASVSVAVSGRIHLAAVGTAGPGVEPRIVAVTNPTPCDFDGRTWPPLPGAEAEGEDLSAYYGATHLTRRAATAAALRGALDDPQVEVVHVAAHGQLNGEGIRVLLTNEADHQAGVLSERELPPRLAGTFVVLTCCWLGASAEELPDEARGFPTWLLRAGASGVVAPLWPVEDRAAGAFTAAFYRHWVGGGLPPARALALARADLRRWGGDETRDPRERADLLVTAEAFTVFGC
ncbi:CHAT domain-containing protein [Nocardioides sp. W7]|uniref:CHAT domain-containing protein n=1 Tax=Nocardioides sp. W7 TaxID=2931390 RepID=UPI001FD01A47|nr:CHAT domain-containing protein [Nocardioides sp. W7]